MQLEPRNSTRDPIVHPATLKVAQRSGQGVLLESSITFLTDRQ